MTQKEAVLKSLAELNKLSTYKDVCQHIQDHNYYDFGNALTPEATISAQLGDFITDLSLCLNFEIKKK